MNVNYPEAARRHLKDAHILLDKGRRANAGQLLGFSVECALKALLVACGVPIDSEGNITGPLRQHEPMLGSRIVSHGHLIPDGRYVNYFALLNARESMSDWSIDHRYHAEASLPLSSVPDWELVALEALGMLEQADLDGIFQ